MAPPRADMYDPSSHCWIANYFTFIKYHIAVPHIWDPQLLPEHWGMWKILELLTGSLSYSSPQYLLKQSHMLPKPLSANGKKIIFRHFHLDIPLATRHLILLWWPHWLWDHQFVVNFITLKIAHTSPLLWTHLLYDRLNTFNIWATTCDIARAFFISGQSFNEIRQ